MKGHIRKDLQLTTQHSTHIVTFRLAAGQTVLPLDWPRAVYSLFGKNPEPDHDGCVVL